MSAFIHDRRHIDHLVTALIYAELIACTPDEAGRTLWGENLRSVAYCYPNEEDGNRAGAPSCDFRDSDVDTYTWTQTPVLDGAVLHAAIKGYIYQSCEHPEWDTSEAKRLVTALAAPVSGLPITTEGWALS